jgi:isocitrate dehydrogenase kinase/phosphatase
MAQVKALIFVTFLCEDAKNETLFKSIHFKGYCCSESKARREKNPSKNMKDFHSYHGFLSE